MNHEKSNRASSPASEARDVKSSIFPLLRVTTSSSGLITGAVIPHSSTSAVLPSVWR